MTSESKTGREMDHLIAEKVMGWRTSTISPNVWYSEAEHNSFHKDTFRLSESIEAATKVVKKMFHYPEAVYDRFLQRLTCNCPLSNDAPWKVMGWWFSISNKAEVICLAALAAIESSGEIIQI